MKINRFPRETNSKRRWLAVLAILATLLGLLAASVSTTSLAAPVAGPTPDPEKTLVYLPLVVAVGQPAQPPASAYAAALSQALADCAATTLNQVCYARGSVTLDGGGPLTTPGQVAGLDGVSGLTLVSPDAGHWSVALLRLAADSSTPDLGLTLLAFGNVEIHNLTLFDAAAGNWNVAPALSFSSSPVPGQDPETGALIVYNPDDEELLSIRLNGVDLTLGSSAVVQAQPGNKMTVTMATGGALVNTAYGDGAVILTQQLTVPLDSAGTAAGAPTAPTEIDEDLLEPLVSHEEDLLEPLVPPLIVDLSAALRDLQTQFESAQDRCMQGNSRQVYRVMWFARILKKNEAHLPDGLLSLIDVEVMQCAAFELEFNSVITTTSAAATGSMYIQGQGMIVNYDMDGHLVQPAQMPLTHLHYDMNFGWGSCAYVTLDDGTMGLFDGYMRINRNRLDISTTVSPVGVWEHLIVTCGDLGEIANAALWSNLFRALHQSEASLGYFKFTPDHWKYTGNHILAEAIFSRQAPFVDGTTNGDTWLVMIHSPGH